ncbi:MAG: SDR family NAD(P)-dependent oxidoreductase, partial [Actinobacteria bacterium]|nr:SDR family NAD(P)-dependent oxidoreductase [Actinomycetota bacterium]
MAAPVPEYPAAHGLLADKTVVVTAAAGTGIGFALAKRCSEEGASVLISDLHERRLGEAADRIADETGKRPATQLCNVTNEDEVQALVAAGIDQLGHIDVWMNNAGLGGNAAVVDMTDEQWSKVLDITLTGTFRCLRAVLPHMYERGSGAIVNNASVLGWRAQELQAHYAAAKA